jgi:hypothetical protein
MIIDVHTHFFPPGYLEALRRVPDPYAIDRDADGRTILTLHGARIATMTHEMTSPEDRTLGLRDEAAAGILGETAARLFPRLARAAGQAAPGDEDA